MKIKIGILLIAILACVQGCIPSLHPLWTKDKLVYIDNLVGIWEHEESDREIVWDFSGGMNTEKQEADAYDLQYEDSGAKAEFEVHLLKLGETLFLDFFPGDLSTLEYNGAKAGTGHFSAESKEKPDYLLNGLYVEHLLPIHTFAKVEIEANEVRIHRFDPDYIDKLFKERRVRIQHEETIDGQTVLTAPTSDLQKFFEKYANDEKAFIDPIVLVRKGE